jgi:hypothetical protein
MKLEFTQRIFGKSQISSFIKIRPVGSELFHADKQTDMTKAVVVFAIFRTRLKIGFHLQSVGDKSPLTKLPVFREWND